MSSSSDDISAMSFEDYTDSLVIMPEEIESATNNFSDENFIAQGSSFRVYKGQLLLQSGELLHIVARKCLQQSIMDPNWEPKLHGLGFVVVVGKHLVHTTTKYNGSVHHMDPAYELTGGLTHKSDIFSFGVLLFEVLFGREASIQDNDNWYFARLARSHYEEGKLDDLIDSGLRNQMNLQSLNLFAETAYWCIKEQRSQRPDMNQILQRLESALDLQNKHEHPTTAFEVEGTSSDRLKGKNLDHLRLRFSDIELATNNFSKIFYLGSGGYGEVYKAELDHFNGIDSSTIEGENEGELRMKRSTVAIKRLFTREDEQGERGFVAEIETLSNCNHPNVVPLLGFCDERSELILIYEYVTNGSLAGYLGNSDTLINLTWDQRLQICLNIANGLSYLHAFTDDKPMIVHRDIKSENILLDDNWVAKIADFGLSKLHANREVTTLVTNNIAGTEVYLDPEYVNIGKLKKESDIYSFGVVMFEILCGRLAYDKIYGEKGLVSIVRQRFNEGTLEEMVDPRLKEGDETVSMLIGGVNQDSLSTFLKIANQCLAETQSNRPTMEFIINELEKALNLQKNNLQVSLKAIEAGTQNFSDYKCIGEGRYWKLYEGEVALANRGCTQVLAKRWDSKSGQAHNQFLTELHILYKYKHRNVIGFVGYGNELSEKIIIYEHAYNKRLDMHLDNCSLTWMKRLQICTDVVVGLEFLHGKGGVDPIIHGDIRSGSILLDADWNAKISNLEWSRSWMEIYRSEHLDDRAFYSLGYTDPECQTDSYFSLSSDIYSIGVFLVEMLCGRLAWANGCEDHSQLLGPLVAIHYKEKGNLYEMIFEGIKEQIAPQSLTTFQRIALLCLENEREDRPDISDVVIQLKKALTFQEDYEIWEPKLPVDYKEIIQISKNSDMYESIETKKDLYDTFCNGILLQDGKVWFSLGSNGERNEMISAKRFSYKNHSLPKWRSLPESRFPKVAEMLNISNLNIHIKIRTRLLSPHVNYKVHLIFRFHPRKSQAKQMFVNLKYKMGNECLNAYFAKWRDDGWMTIELFHFLNRKKDTDFEVVLESLSRCYCGNDSIYIEGILFQAINNTILLKEHVPQILLNQIVRQKDEILSAEEVVYNSSSVAVQSRFSGAIELLRQQVLRIKCKVKSQMLAPNKETACCLVFQVPEGSCGLCGPVMVRDLFNRRSKETGVVYFRNPNLWNIQDTDWLPKRRLDGWMEVIVWKFKSNYELKDNHLFVNLKLVTYEGTMSGLIVRGIRFRQI